MHLARFRTPTGAVRRGELRDGQLHAADRTFDPEAVDFLPPTEPSKVVCQAGGYVDHREESGLGDVPDRPELFLKTPNCVVGHGDEIELPPGRETVDFEAEFAIVIGTQCRAADVDEAMDYVEGYTCVNDVSNRDDQEVEQNWVRGKAFDGSLPAGPVVATPDEVPDDASLELRHNGEVKQETSREHMIFSVPELVANVSELVTLEPGDLIATGTPFGPYALSDGDVVEVEFEGVGTLRNEVVAP
jgi:2-keto-4-pentenoate hydratase/2-oxohepta-3-ene-1,7-dioic acid hydratase in catechol pathway